MEIIVISRSIILLLLLLSLLSSSSTKMIVLQIRLQTKFLWPPRNREHLFGVRNTTTLTVIAKKTKRVSLFVSRFSPDVTDRDKKEKSLDDQLNLHQVKN
jgi:hypothetical protein